MVRRLLVIRDRLVLVAPVAALVLIRTLSGADDFVNWDLTAFLNANAFDSFAELLERPEVHLRRPFSFPQYNVGAESVLSALLFRSLGRVDLHAANVVVVLVYSATFLAMVAVLFRRLFDGDALAAAWMLLPMSTVILTTLSTSAFNVQGYCIVLIGILGADFFVTRRFVIGLVLTGLAFLLISQAYPIAFYFPHFAAVWAVFRTCLHPRGETARTRLFVVAVYIGVLAMAAIAVNFASDGAYFAHVAPGDPYSRDSTVSIIGRLRESVGFFVRQSIWPVERQDGFPLGFAPYGIYAAAIATAVLAKVEARRRRRASDVADGRCPTSAALPVLLCLGLVVVGYLPSFISVLVKSQRALLGDLFVVIAVALALQSALRRGWVRWASLRGVLGGTLFLSSAVYLFSVLGVDHSRVHWPRFDFDQSDGLARHDLTAIIRMMKQQSEVDGAAVIIHYPRGYSENRTDPAMFFARMLRHHSRYRENPRLSFTCKWCAEKECNGCLSYGCAFPEVRGRECSADCCWTEPAELRRGPGKVFLWWHEVADGLPRKPLPGISLERALAKLATSFRVWEVPVPPEAFEWRCYELLPRGDEVLPAPLD